MRRLNKSVYRYTRKKIRAFESSDTLHHYAPIEIIVINVPRGTIQISSSIQISINKEQYQQLKLF